MTHFRFVHASDLHLDTPYEGIGRVDPEVAATLRDASLEAWDALVKLTIDREADFLLLAGDIYDGSDRGVRAQLRFLRGVEELSRRAIQVFIVYGNHDPLDGWDAIRSWPTGVTIFGADEVRAVPAERQGEQLALVHGISYPKRDVTENLALRFTRGTEAAFTIGLLHCNVGRDPEHPTYSPCSLDDLQAAGMDYWALGHIHKRQILRDGHPWIVYSGNLQGRSLKPSERGPKGALVVEVTEGLAAEPVFVPVDRVRSVVLDVDTTDLADIPALSKSLLDQARSLRVENEDRGLLVRAILRGKGKLHYDLRPIDRLAELLSDLRQEVKDDGPFVWWESLVDDTRPELDLQAIAARGDFSSEVMRVAEALEDHASLRELLESPPRLGIHRWMADPSPDEQREFLRKAKELAVDVLEMQVEP